MSDRRFLLVLAGLLALLVLILFAPLGCNNKSAQPRTHQSIHHVVHVYHMEDGSTAYQGMDGFWYWRILYANAGSSSTSSPVTPSSSRLWSRQTYAPWAADPARGKIVSDDEESIQQIEQETSSALIEEPEQEQVEVAEPDAPEASPSS